MNAEPIIEALCTVEPAICNCGQRGGHPRLHDPLCPATTLVLVHSALEEVLAQPSRIKAIIEERDRYAAALDGIRHSTTQGAGTLRRSALKALHGRTPKNLATLQHLLDRAHEEIEDAQLQLIDRFGMDQDEVVTRPLAESLVKLEEERQ